MTRQYRPKAGFWIRLCVALLYPIGGAMFRIRWRHLERMPERQGVIVALNHLSQIDTILMARLIWQSGRVPRFLIKSGVFALPIVGRIMRGAGQIPVHRGTDDAAKSLKDAVRALERGECIVIYPEGTYTRDPGLWPMQGKTGVARLVLLRPETPVVPVGQWGPSRRPGLQKLIPTRRTAAASVGEPLDLSRYRGIESSAGVLREVTDTIMTAVAGQVAELRGGTPPTQFHVPAKGSTNRG